MIFYEDVSVEKYSGKEATVTLHFSGDEIGGHPTDRETHSCHLTQEKWNLIQDEVNSVLGSLRSLK
jgi:hypothetical protein